MKLQGVVLDDTAGIGGMHIAKLTRAQLREAVRRYPYSRIEPAPYSTSGGFSVASWRRMEIIEHNDTLSGAEWIRR